MISMPRLPEWKPSVAKRCNRKPRSLRLVGLPFLLILRAIASLSIRVRCSNPEERNILEQKEGLPGRHNHSCPGRYLVFYSPQHVLTHRRPFLETTPFPMTVEEERLPAGRLLNI